MINMVLFVIFPYVALILAVVGGIQRYVIRPFSYSSLSSQFFEKRQQFWGSIHFHYGVVLILTAHLLAALFPGFWSRLVGAPVRLYVLEITGAALGVFAVLGLALLIVRRRFNSRARVVTSMMDWILLAVLLVQVVTGVIIALIYRWGSVWYLHTAVPWLWSLARLSPQTNSIAALPWIAKLHFLNAFVLVALYPFSRLVHVFTIPISYLWRPYQVVIWNRRMPGTDSVLRRTRQ